MNINELATTENSSLKVAITEKGCCQYYQLDKDNHLYHIIQMNKKMLDFDEELFFWILHNKILIVKKIITKDISVPERTEQYEANKKRIMKLHQKFLLKHFFVMVEYARKKKKYFALTRTTPIPDTIICYADSCIHLTPEQEKKIINFVDGL